MLQGWIVIACALGYIGLLFVVASYGDRTRRFGRVGRSRLFIYPLSLAIYCTSWTFFGSVGLASRTGYDFLTIYVGPVLMIGFCSPVIMRIVRLAKTQNITSIADFIAARYGKAQTVAEALGRGLRRAHIGAHRYVHADIACGTGEHCADGKADGLRHPEQISEDEKDDDADNGDCGVLAREVSSSAFLDRRRDFLHARGAGICGEHGARGDNPVNDGENAASNDEIKY